MSRRTINFHVVGCGLSGPGYPNAINTLGLLRNLPGIAIKDNAYWLGEDFHLWKLVSGTLRQRIRRTGQLAWGNAVALLRLRRIRRDDTLYLPYPSLPLLWLLSWLPSHRQPHCIADAYITLWDTLYQDRQLGRRGSLASRLLLRAESRALRTAYRIVVDTQANADHVSRLFGVDRQRIVALPLALDSATLPAQAVTTASAREGNKSVRVLFIGTFVPLQGTEVIARTIALLRDNTDMDFMLIGDGQQATAAAPLLKNHPRLTWLRGWQSPDMLAMAVAEADICLGVFGGPDKAARVLPFKLYMALAAGKCVVTQQDFSVPDGCPPPPMATCAPDPGALAACLTRLARDATVRQHLGEQGAAYFQQYLGPERLRQAWHALVFGDCEG